MTFGRHRNCSPWFLDVNEDCVDGKEISENKDFLKKYPTCEEWDNGSENGE